ncbi:uncharacterized protein LOC132277452 [Cornus florida]|uniref:uncharacterized protein LOC132277452 n=1 Tax=Cornus florida TaxID=4283 RepID=UPI0028A104B4|nr:uncharacterized protein LOC132277452 [Cornus florida]
MGGYSHGVGAFMQASLTIVGVVWLAGASSRSTAAGVAGILLSRAWRASLNLHSSHQLECGLVRSRFKAHRLIVCGLVRSRFKARRSTVYGLAGSRFKARRLAVCGLAESRFKVRRLRALNLLDRDVISFGNWYFYPFSLSWPPEPSVLLLSLSPHLEGEKKNLVSSQWLLRRTNRRFSICLASPHINLQNHRLTTEEDSISNLSLNLASFTHNFFNSQTWWAEWNWKCHDDNFFLKLGRGKIIIVCLADFWMGSCYKTSSSFCLRWFK